MRRLLMASIATRPDARIGTYSLRGNAPGVARRFPPKPESKSSAPMIVRRLILDNQKYKPTKKELLCHLRWHNFTMTDEHFESDGCLLCDYIRNLISNKDDVLDFCQMVLDIGKDANTIIDPNNLIANAILKASILSARLNQSYPRG